jgi:uncharacterized YccA/Bax inhibitor family protein
MATANPAMNPAVYQRAGLAESPFQIMTVQGAALYGGFSLLVTLIWMYLEILRLLAKLSANRG